MKVLVTGGAGFIGSHLCETLALQGHEVTCFDNLSTGILEVTKNFASNIKFIKGDANTTDLNKVFQNDFDWVFHHAFVVGVKRTLENPVSVLEGAKGILNVMELSRKKNVKRVVFASSSEVYGNPLVVPEREEGPLNAQLPYAVTKLFCEKCCESYYHEFGMKTCSLRFFNVYGPRQDSSDYGFVVGIFIKQVLASQNPIIFGDGSATRDFVYIDDNIKATIAAATSNKVDGSAINVGNGKAVTIRELAEKVIKISGRKLRVEYREERPLDIKHRVADISKMKQQLGFTPQVTLEEGLKKTMEYYNGK